MNHECLTSFIHVLDYSDIRDDSVSSLIQVAVNDEGFIMERDMDGFLVTENPRMMSGQPIHTNDGVEATEGDRHKVDGERFVLQDYSAISQDDVGVY